MSEPHTHLLHGRAEKLIAALKKAEKVRPSCALHHQPRGLGPETFQSSVTTHTLKACCQRNLPRLSSLLTAVHSLPGSPSSGMLPEHMQGEATHTHCPRRMLGYEEDTLQRRSFMLWGFHEVERALIPGSGKMSHL